uniref:Uncharacterized protein n=1 Tax=Knipowitschia caucasica TaxID=637954 RepID=A0AAV2JPV0_KNICA
MWGRRVNNTVLLIPQLLHLEAIQEEEEEDEDGDGDRAQASVALDTEQSSEKSSEKSSERLEEDEEPSEEEIFVDTPLRARSSRRRRPRPSTSGLPKSKSSLFNATDASPQKVDLFPDWVVQLMFNIEEATQHKLVVE